MLRTDEWENTDMNDVIWRFIDNGWLRATDFALGVGGIFDPLVQDGLDEFPIGEVFPYGYYVWPTRLMVKIDLIGRKVQYRIDTPSLWGLSYYETVPEGAFYSVVDGVLSGRMGRYKAVRFGKPDMLRKRKVWSLNKPVWDNEWYEKCYEAIHEVSVLRVSKAWEQNGYKPLNPGDYLMCLRKEVKGSYNPYAEYWWISKDVADKLVKIDSGETAAKVVQALTKHYSENITAADVKRALKEVS